MSEKKKSKTYFSKKLVCKFKVLPFLSIGMEKLMPHNARPISWTCGGGWIDLPLFKQYSSISLLSTRISMYLIVLHVHLQKVLV